VGEYSERAAGPRTHVPRWRATPGGRRPRAGCRAQTPAVAPVVRTSSTSRTLAGTGRPDARKAPSRASRRSAPERRACGPCPAARASSAIAGVPVRAASARASTFAWSYPREASRDRASGTHVTASADGGPVATTAAASASATDRQPENFSRWIERRAGPWNRKAARAMSMDPGGQSRQDAPGDRRDGRTARTRAAPRHERGRARPQNGHGPVPHPAHERGKTTSRASDHTAAP
jgi:hypothetical protein